MLQDRRRWEGPFAALMRHRSLTWELSKREVLGRYRGASFGMAWSVISPFMMLGVYAFAFGTVMKSRWPPEAGGGHPYTVILFVGLILHGFLAECLNRAPTLIVANPNFVKRVVFPLDVLPWPMLLSALFHAMMNIVVLVLLMLVLEHHLHISLLLLPLVFIPFILIILGVSWVLASLGVYFRDISQVMPVVATALLFLSSAVIPVSALSPSMQRLFHLNPLTFFIDQARLVVLAGTAPDWSGLVLATLAGLLVAWLGHAWFMATQRGFADVL
ncbi:ABC transporter permease [Rhodanobacter sp. C01]|uniref:ABC transporter permease n=1 Tax=Rhodanobacter sp. C01 TaxID=1945856 RepID=UPI0009870F8B|nr:ABC transporter permease [Rhodanobacter sp. C01]OOG51065.1 sugar ABC transporter permease [Rhodanobacter sp. C01]